MNNSLLHALLGAAIVAASTGFALADDPAPAPAEAHDSGLSAQDRPVPGRSDRTMTPEMQEYIARLEKIRLERDAQARAALKADRDIEERKDAIAEADEQVKALVDKAAELRAALEETEKALSEVWDADEEILRLRSVRVAAEAARVAKQHEMQTAVQAAMRARSASEESGAPDIRSVETARREEAENKPRILIGGKDPETFLSELPGGTNGSVRLVLPHPKTPSSAE